MTNQLCYSPHLYYARIKSNSEYRYQHDGFFPVRQLSNRQGSWVGNDNIYLEDQIMLFMFDTKQGFRQFNSTTETQEIYSLEKLERLDLKNPKKVDLILRDNY
ncbi:hypothetical protein QX776_07340 [Alteromonadaceae bacterium BrNp21-10]|nr:hypothetical protein [Alteromonadaceae bacterium BrNp21-10]